MLCKLVNTRSKRSNPSNYTKTLRKPPDRGLQQLRRSEAANRPILKPSEPSNFDEIPSTWPRTSCSPPPPPRPPPPPPSSPTSHQHHRHHRRSSLHSSPPFYSVSCRYPEKRSRYDIYYYIMAASCPTKKRTALGRATRMNSSSNDSNDNEKRYIKTTGENVMQVSSKKKTGKLSEWIAWALNIGYKRNMKIDDIKRIRAYEREFTTARCLLLPEVSEEYSLLCLFMVRKWPVEASDAPCKFAAAISTPPPPPPPPPPLPRLPRIESKLKIYYFLVTQNVTRSCTNRNSNMFEKFQEEKLQYRHEKNYYEQVEGKNSWDRSLRDATELHDVQPEGRRILQIMKED
ncbi:hypothetical protein V1478_017865 [Vespula squamosa]|uniref:Uncharacterized protein n=1 Tax=Vespula squamosa TaxID=30214 RepID=A0ABD1ZW43_VESSQ